MGYGFAMRINLLLVGAGMVFMFVAAPRLRADVLGVQNAGPLWQSTITLTPVRLVGRVALP